MDKTGLAWYSDDPDGYKLYVFHLGSGTGGTRISKVHPGTGAVLTVATISAQQGDRAGGCDISSDWNSMLTVFGGVFQNPQGEPFGNAPDEVPAPNGRRHSADFF